LKGGEYIRQVFLSPKPTQHAKVKNTGTFYSGTMSLLGTTLKKKNVKPIPISLKTPLTICRILLI